MVDLLSLQSFDLSHSLQRLQLALLDWLGGRLVLQCGNTSGTQLT